MGDTASDLMFERLMDWGVDTIFGLPGVAEQHLLPALRSAPDALVIADGFSCRSQVKQDGGREALHIAQAIALAQTARARD